jgi:branched-chain amino acid transport system substrate-binding protein
MHGHKGRAGLLASTVLTLVAAACGSSGKSATTTVGAAATTTTAAPATTAGAATTEGAATTAAPTGVDRTGETIKVGYVNNEGGAFSLPEFRIGGEVAIDYINKNGGVNGAKIEIVNCNADASPEGSINCANQLIDAKVSIAYTGIDVASDAALPLYSKAGIPFVTSNSWGTAQRNDPDSFVLHSASSAYVLAPLQTFKDLGLKKIAVMLEDTPAGQDFMKNVVKPVGEGKLGLSITPVFVDAANPDWTRSVTIAQASDPEAIWGQLTEPGCIGLVTATSTVGFAGPVFAGSCSVYIGVLGDKAVGTYTQGDSYIPEVKKFAPPDIQKNLDLYEQAMKAAGQDKYLNGFAVAPFGAWMELKLILQTIPKGPITPDTVKAAFAAAKDIPGFFGTALHCGNPPFAIEKSHCRDDLLVFKVVKSDAGVVREPFSKGFVDFTGLLS